MSNSKRKCAGCGERFRPDRSFPGLVAWCSDECATSIAIRKMPQVKERQRKEMARQTRAEKEAMKSKGQLTKEAQQAFNAWIRHRDHGKPCISCSALPAQKRGGTMDAGHYRSTGSCPELRFDEHNCHAQCVRCNRDLSGNSVDYRRGLIRRIGLAEVERIEAHNSPARLSKDDLRKLRDDYRKRARK